jgi:hypothetical protein
MGDVRCEMAWSKEEGGREGSRKKGDGMVEGRWVMGRSRGDG